MSEVKAIDVETHQHEITSIGFTADNKVVITFDNGPCDGELILAPNTFESLHRQWMEHKGT